MGMASSDMTVDLLAAAREKFSLCGEYKSTEIQL
jgi:hypothetical protein